MYCRQKFSAFWVTLSMLYLCFLASTLMAETTKNINRGTTIAQHSFGYALQAVDSFDIVSANAKMTFVIELPPIPTIQVLTSVNCSQVHTLKYYSFTNGSSTKCHALSPSLELMFNTQQRILTGLQHHVQSIYDLIKDFDSRPTRGRRAWLPFIGSILHTVAGVSKDETDADLRMVVNRLQRITVEQMDTWKDSTNAFMTATKLNSDRINNLVRMVERH